MPLECMTVAYPGEKDCTHLWLKCENSRYLAVSAVACSSHLIALDSLVTMSVIEHEKYGTIVF